MDDNSEIKFERMSEQRPGMIPGDVIMVLKQKAHAQYRREKNDLHYNLMISLKESLIGFTRTIRHLDGHEVVRLSLSLSLSFSFSLSWPVSLYVSPYYICYIIWDNLYVT